VALEPPIQRVLSYPADWPGPGPIDLAVHDLPHASSTLEWWYVNAHLTVSDGQELALFAAFFRTAVGYDQAAGAYRYAHALTWALVDPARQRYLAESLVDPDAPAIARARLDRGEGITDPLLRRAMREVLERGAIPGPDRLMLEPAQVSQERLALDFDGRRLENLADGSYLLQLTSSEQDGGCRLRFSLEKPVVRHGEEGVLRSTSAEEMFYYLSPRCQVEGTLTLDGQSLQVSQGQGWYDHEFGCPPSEPAAPGVTDQERTVSWDWISGQLDNGWDLTLQRLFGSDQQTLAHFALLIDPAGQPRRYERFEWQSDRVWTSSKTFQRYPTAWTIAIPDANLELHVDAVFEAQEFQTSISRPAFWEGRVELAGSFDGTPESGVGFVERSGVDAITGVEQFFDAVGQETRRSVRELLPFELDRQSAAALVAGAGRADLLDGIDLAQLARTIVRPIRTIVDRGGKAWRSYVALACCDAVGGDSQPLIDWLALPEVVHVGSLIVDDVQDRSTVRRGGPAAHLLYGEPTAINAGSACYFLPMIFFERVELPDRDKLRLYGLYFEAVRAAHAGQALDIDGYGQQMPGVVERGDGVQAERHVRAVHRLKSGVPAGCLARVGVVLGGGSEAQLEAVGEFVESLGLAFQIVDDLLNLSGFERDLKSQGEDVTAGKITMPVAKAMSLLDLAGRRRLWEILGTGPTERELIAEAIELMRGCGALEACRTEAEQLIEMNWTKVAPLLPDSYAKLMLRVFGWQVLRRTY
jgi:geranylgeranyl pyrophosphate synthase/predicted secreted hydrolase